MRATRLSRREMLQLFLLQTQQRAAVSERTEAQPRPVAVVRTALRPPGAIDEARFLDTCATCHDCVDACPFDAIAVAADGRPFVAPEAMPCVSCLDVPCSRACGSGALAPVDHPRDIRMGPPVWIPIRVWRSRETRAKLALTHVRSRTRPSA